ncbi:hypothetical protein BXY66_1075 [Shimia isoporae]|uniref:Uncharacterized protein n=1 Tax=Shimia isoporae TaxID=647720 RepID=A0A4R1NQP7_9RHOB|nr:hypothetical protein [Shimia isoporae]TCL09033.1 hypothetical protein BXY66_1075 [Shimia isoporae]
MSERPKQVFLERQSYRRRRLIDFIRMVPVIGAILWAVPLLWSTEDGESVATSDAVVYVFVVWFGLVVCGGILARALRDGRDGSEEGRE